LPYTASPYFYSAISGRPRYIDPMYDPDYYKKPDNWPDFKWPSDSV
jgi:hypothetical protein